MPQIGRPRLIDVLENADTNDYIRLSTLELCGREILDAGILGSMAELGVYQGRFASKMNALLPDRTLYLFDTFEGFEASQQEHDNVHHALKHTRDFSDTSVELVLARMSRPDRCVIKKGFFPATAVDVADKFCLVSLDADLYEPLLAGLEWFWPRLVKGGYILVHDYNNSNFPGARAAVRRFAADSGIPFVPVTDPYGTAIFAR